MEGSSVPVIADYLELVSKKPLTSFLSLNLFVFVFHGGPSVWQELYKRPLLQDLEYADQTGKWLPSYNASKGMVSACRTIVEHTLMVADRCFCKPLITYYCVSTQPQFRRKWTWRTEKLNGLSSDTDDSNR